MTDDDIPGLLITGGRYNDGSVELWAPGPGSIIFRCPLPSMVRDRYHHTVTGSGLVCGGGGSDTQTSCEMFSEGSWVLLDNRLSEGRLWHSAWLQPTTNTTFLLGGDSSRSVETMSSEGEVAQAALTLKHDVR